MTRFIDIHLLQALPLSNLNRDDLGAPKTVKIGGVVRTRGSSQCWKRPTRLSIEDRFGEPAVRTRYLGAQVANRLMAQGWSQELAATAATQILASTGKKGLKLEDDGATSALFYVPITVLDELAALAMAHRAAIEQTMGKKNPKPILPTDKITSILKSRNGTISLFGRMLAELPATEVDGAVQVAHAFTTHETEPEIDFFTAVDDLPPQDQRGSSHMNSAEFSAGVFYRYANVDVTGLIRNLDGDTAMARELVTAFLDAFARVIPSGKQTATAATTLPDLAYLAVRSDRPTSLASAFESPVHPENGFGAPSRRELSRYADRLRTLWGTEGISFDGYACIDDKPLAGLGTAMDSFSGLVSRSVAEAFGAHT